MDKQLRFKKQWTTAQMVQRYLHAVEFWLPRKQRRDLLAEISDDLCSQIEAREAGLGRPLNESEIEALLKQRGRPLVVANGYRPQQSLIGPLWFPTYLAVMKVALFGYVPLWLAVYVVVERVQNPGVDWATTLLSTWSMAWTVAFFASCVVTLVFAAVEWIESRMHFMEQWQVCDLPQANDPHKIKRANSIAEILVGVLFLLWWMSAMHSREILNGPSLKITLTPVWMYYFWGCLAIGWFNIGLTVANLRRPYWNNLRASLRLASDLVAGALFCWLLKADVVGTVFVAHLDAAGTMKFRSTILLVIDRCFPFAVIVMAVALAVDVTRLVRINGKDEPGIASKAMA